MRSLQRVLAAAAGTLAAVGLVALPAASSPATPAGDGLDAIHRALVEDGTPHLHPRLANGPGVARGRRGGITPLSVESDSHGRTTVFVDGADKAALKRAVDSVGGTVTGSIDGTVRADVPTSALHTLALRAGVDTVRPQEKLVADAVTSEGVAKAGADAWQSVGTGAGVKVGVVDLGFGGLADAQASGDLPPTGPALSVTAEAGCTDVNADTHGTAVTEIVHDMAPDAQLVLVCVADNIDVAAAADFLQQQGVSVVNMSLSDPEALARGDGTGQLGDVIKKSRQQGLLWSIAAGNDGDHFFRGKATDHSGDGWVEFSGTDAFNNFQVAPDSVGALNLRWDAWPTTATEVDVVVMQSRRVPTGPDDPDLVAVLSADMTGKTRWNPQSGFFGFDNTGFADPWNLWVLVHNESAPQATQFDITIAGPVSALKYRTGGSIAEPANSPYAMAVGAVCVNSGTIEPYSSQGPTIDGRAKPDISASDGVSTTTFGPDSGGAS